MPWRHQFQITASRRFGAGAVVTVERSRRYIVIELGAAGGELRLKVIEDRFGQPERIGRRLQHQRRDRADDRRLGHAAFAVARDVVDHFAAAGGMADVDGLLEVEMFGERGQIVGVMIHVVAVIGLGGTAVPAPVVGDDAIALLEEEQHLSVPVIRRERPAVRENNRLSSAPVLVIDLCSVFCGDRRHWSPPFDGSAWADIMHESNAFCERLLTLTAARHAGMFIVAILCGGQLLAQTDPGKTPPSAAAPANPWDFN